MDLTFGNVIKNGFDFVSIELRFFCQSEEEDGFAESYVQVSLKNR